MRALLFRISSRVLAAAGVAAGVTCGGSPNQPSPPPTSPPAITCPAPVTVVATQTTNVAFGTPTVTGGTQPVTITCSPASGTPFPLGITPVLCTATDAQQRSSVCNFAVSVQRPPTLTLTRFLAFGDSITAGEDGTPQLRAIILPFQNYPFVLQGKLAARYLSQTPVVDNRGAPGEFLGSAGALSRFSSELSPVHQAVLIMHGSNDVNGINTFANALANAQNNLGQMVRLAKARGVRPYVATVPPMNSMPTPGWPYRGGGWASINTWNGMVRAVASAEQVTLVDVHAAFAGDMSLLSPDGLHPNAQGFERIAETFFQSIRATIEVAP